LKGELIFTQTKASTSESPVLEVGLVPNPAPATLHQFPHFCCLVG
jgi:hypothetical protein